MPRQHGKDTIYCFTTCTRFICAWHWKVFIIMHQKVATPSTSKTTSVFLTSTQCLLLFKVCLGNTHFSLSRPFLLVKIKLLSQLLVSNKKKKYHYGNKMGYKCCFILAFPEIAIRLKVIVWTCIYFHQKYSDMKTPAPGFDFETCSAQPNEISLFGVGFWGLFFFYSIKKKIIFNFYL